MRRSCNNSRQNKPLRLRVFCRSLFFPPSLIVFLFPSDAASHTNILPQLCNFPELYSCNGYAVVESREFRLNGSSRGTLPITAARRPRVFIYVFCEQTRAVLFISSPTQRCSPKFFSRDVDGKKSESFPGKFSPPSERGAVSMFSCGGIAPFMFPLSCPAG